MAGNYIGTDTTGTLALGNGGDGVTIESGRTDEFIGGVDTVVGESLAGLGNLIRPTRATVSRSGGREPTARRSRGILSAPT